MLGNHLARSRAVQQMSLWALSASTCGLSLYFTICFMRHLWPRESLVVVGAFGGAWELAKVQFGPLALAALWGNNRKHLGAHVALLVLTSCLMLGSIVASIGHIAQSHDLERAEASTRWAADKLHAAQASDAYQHAQHAVASLDAEIDALGASLANDLAHNYRTRGAATSTVIGLLRDRRDIALAEAARIENASTQLAEPFDLFANMGEMLPGDSQVNSERIKLVAHVFLAVMLELVGVAAWSLSNALLAGSPSSSTHAPAGPAPSGPRPHDAVTRPIGLAVGPLVARRVSRRCHTPLLAQTGTSRIGRHARYAHRTPTPSAAVPVRARQLSYAPGTKEKYEEAVRLIMCRTLVPSHRWLRYHLRVGQQTAQAFLQRLYLEGYLERTGRRYALTAHGEVHRTQAA